MIYEHIKQLCNDNKITINQLEKNCNLGTSSIKKWETRSAPSAIALAKIADYFDVSVDYLLGRKDYADIPAIISASPIQKLYDQLDEVNKRTAIQYLEVMLDNQRERSNKRQA